jgi:transposase
MRKRSIYGDRSQELLRLYEDAGSSGRVMCVALDWAKRHHMAMLCDGGGQILRKPFAVENTAEGVATLAGEVTAWCGRRGIAERHVFFGGEDAASYAENFVTGLRARGWLVAGVNAHDAKRERSTVQASTDRVDLMGIARMLVNKRGNCTPAQVGASRNLRTMVRHRRRLVGMSTAVGNRIHGVVDRLFPGFLDEKKSGISPFSKGSLWLMEHRFSAGQIRRRKRRVLIEGLRRCGTSEPEDAVTTLQEYAGRVLTSPREYVGTLQVSLAQHVRHYRCLEESALQAEKEMAVWLAQTPGAFLTTVRGVGIVLASGVAGEIGDPMVQEPVTHLSSYAGIVPRVSQSGGPEGTTYTGAVAKRSNRILKDYVVQIGQHLGLHGPEELMEDYHRRDAAGQHAAFGMARRFLRMAMHLMRAQEAYLSPQLRCGSVTQEERAQYYAKLWPLVREKWERAGAKEVAFAPENPLGQWRLRVQEVYGIRLSV